MTPEGEPRDGLDTRALVVAWFHDSEEICEHDYEPWPCDIMADHLLAAFDVKLRDWGAYTADNRLAAALVVDPSEPNYAPGDNR